jgi:hypothetical protein
LKVPGIVSGMPKLERAGQLLNPDFKIIISNLNLPRKPNFMIFEAIENSRHYFRDA